MSAVLLEARGIGKRFGGVQALKDVSLTIKSAPMIEPLAPSLTKKVPTIDVMMQAPQMASGYIIIRAFCAASAKKMAASTMVAMSVTA